MLQLVHPTRRQSRQSAMRAIQVAIGRARTIQQLCRSLHHELGGVLNASGLLVGLYDEVSQMVEVVYQIDGGQEVPGGSFPLGRGFNSEAIRTRRPRLIRHWSVEGPRVQLQYATDRPDLPESAITIPLLVHGRATGVLSIQSYDVDAFDEDDLLLVQAVAAHVAPALELLQHASAVQATRRASELEAILASMTEALLVLDREGRIVSLNPPARAMFGAGVVLGQRLDQPQAGTWPLGARAIAEAVGPVLEALQRGEAMRDLELEINGDGRRLLSFSSSPICDAAGLPAGGVVAFHDVTTQREVARLKDELLSVASHDLRTPVTVLKCEAQLIQRTLRLGNIDAQRLEQRVGMIVEQADRLSSMLNLLLDLSRVEAGRLDLALEPTDLVALVRRTLKALQALTTDHVLRLRTPVERLEGLWDPARLEQVLQNLLTNAVKYSPGGGPIDVVIGMAKADTVSVSVRDQGLGIPRDDLPHLFERYYRVAATRTLEGTGLGLYICHGIIAAHGGHLWVDSAGPGTGSTFTFSLPF